MNRTTELKGLVTVGVVSIAISLLFVATDPTATDYEISVYDSYPAVFWFLLLVAILTGQLVIFKSGRPNGRHRYWKWGLVVMLAANVVMLLIPALRYHLYARGDALTYIGMMRQIDALSAVPRSNYYPNVHLLGVTFSYATGIPLTKVVNVLPPLISVFYVLSMYTLLDALFSDSRKVLFVLPFVSLLILGGDHHWFHPSAVAFMLIPFVFWLLFRGYGVRSSYQFRLPLIVAVVSLTLYHPAVTVFFIGMLVLLRISLLVARRVSANRPRKETTSIIAASIAFVIFFTWYYSFESIIGSTLIIVYTLLGFSEGSTALGGITSVWKEISPEVTDILLIGIYKYGFIGAIVSMGAVFLVYRIYLMARGRRQYDPIQAFLGGTLLVFTFGAAVAFVADVTLSFERIARYARFAGGILIGTGFYTLFRRADSTITGRYLRPVLYLSFFVMAYFSMIGLYASPLDNTTNNQITEAEVVGMEWLFENRNRSLVIDHLGINQYRMYSFLESRFETGRNVRWRAPPPPEHFAYENVSPENIPSGAVENRRYLVTTRLGRIRFPRLYPQYPQFWLYAPDDFERLGYDPSFAHVYDDGTLDVHIVSDVQLRTNESTQSSRSALFLLPE